MKKYIVFTIILSITLLSCGCWNRREPENLAIVLAIAFDIEKETKMYNTIAQIANPLAMGATDISQGSTGKEKTFLTLSAKGELPYQAMRNLVNNATREFFWSHNRVVLFSEELARYGIYPTMDMFGRDRQLRTIAQVVVVDGNLKALMEAEFPLEETGARGLDRQIITIRKERSIFPIKPLNELYSTLAQPGRDMFIGRITVPENIEKGAGPSRIGGGAMFHRDRMVGWAEDEHAKGWAYATGRAFRSTLIIKDPMDDKTPISIEVTNIKNNMRLIIDTSGGVYIELKIYAEGRIQDFPVHRDLEIESDYTKSLEQRTAQNIRSTIQSTIDLSRELNSDIIGFGNLIYRKQPKLWEEIGDRWYEVFKDIDIDIKVDMNINRTGFTASPIETKKMR